MKLIIAGTRDFSDYKSLEKEVTKFIEENGFKDVTIISGTCRGADKLGEVYAESNELNLKHYPARWDKYGKSAGYQRNHVMAKKSDALIAFWDGKSKGTEHMINLAKEQDLIVKVINYEESNNLLDHLE